MPISPPRGFSLIEVLLTLAIVSIALATVSLSLGRSSTQAAESELRRFEQVVRISSERAVLLAREHRVLLTSTGYEMNERFQGQWRSISEPEYQRYQWKHISRFETQGDEIRMSSLGHINEKDFIVVAGQKQWSARLNASGRLIKVQ
jgi:prepilin-type N-terminal cleavage/methylation domain-containing protein